MLELDKKYSDKQKVFDELLFGSGVVVFRNIFDLKKIEDKKDIPEKVYEEAKSHIIKAYAKVTDLEKTKRSLCENGPCFIIFPVYNYTPEFWKNLESNLILMLIFHYSKKNLKLIW